MNERNSRRRLCIEIKWTNRLTQLDITSHPQDSKQKVIVDYLETESVNSLTHPQNIEYEN